ncbi:MAG: prefoldin subunit alpha [Thermofilum sp.]|uniref:Prefoldin subunit alpha n=1 Tax=Thermofilum pendens TaxID=2269 RepID=A0A7C4H407_THEPE
MSLQSSTRERAAEEYMALSQLAEEIQREISLAQSLAAEIESTIATLRNVSALEGAKEVLIPLSAGVYMKALVNKQEKFLVNIGSNILVEKNLEETIETLNKRREELTQLINRRVEELNSIIARAQQLRQVLSQR